MHVSLLSTALSINCPNTYICFILHKPTSIYCLNHTQVSVICEFLIISRQNWYKNVNTFSIYFPRAGRIVYNCQSHDKRACYDNLFLQSDWMADNWTKQLPIIPHTKGQYMTHGVVFTCRVITIWGMATSVINILKL